MKTGKAMMAAAVCMAISILGARGACAESQVQAGTYTGTGTGRNGEIQVEVTVEADGTITDITVGENAETPAIAGTALDTLPELMVENQTLNVDSVAGATLTCAGIKKAAEDALAITIHPTQENGGLANSWVADTLYQTAVDAGAAFILNTTADELLTDEAGKVSGIHAVDRTGNTYVIHAKKVILATGGYGGNYEMLKAHTDMETPFYLGPTYNKGWGIEAGESVNAKTAHTTLPDIEGYNSMVYGTVGGLIVDQLDVVHFSAGENHSWNLYSGRIAGSVAAGEL